MSKTVGDLKASVSGILTGANLSTVTSINQALERGLRVMLTQADVPESRLKENVVLYDGVFDYPSPDSIFGQAVVDIRPQGISRTIFDVPYKKSIQTFDQYKQWLSNGTMVAFETYKGTGIMRLSSTRTTPRAILDPMTATSGWTAAGSASGLTLDQTVYYDYPGSLRFTLTGASVGTLTKTLSTQNLSAYNGVGVAFLAVRIPPNATASQLSSIELRIGSSSVAYSTVSSATGFLGAWTVGDWLLISFDFSTATLSGSPDWTKIAYIEVLLTHGATLTNFYVGGLWISLPSPSEVIYQTNAAFMPKGGTTPLTTITDDDDTILLNDAAYTIYEHEAASAVAQNMGGEFGQGSMATINQVLHGVRARNGAVIEMGLYDHYQADNPSEKLRETGNYYDD